MKNLATTFTIVFGLYIVNVSGLLFRVKLPTVFFSGRDVGYDDILCLLC